MQKSPRNCFALTGLNVCISSMLCSLVLSSFRYERFVFLFPQTLYTHIVADIKNINAKHKNNKVNTVSAQTQFFYTLKFLLCDIAAWCSLSVYFPAVFQTLQNFMYTMLRDSNPIAAKISLDVMGELYTRNIWWELYYLLVRWTLFWIRPCRLDYFSPDQIWVTGMMPKQWMSSQRHASLKWQRCVVSHWKQTRLYLFVYYYCISVGTLTPPLHLFLFRSLLRVLNSSWVKTRMRRMTVIQIRRQVPEILK